MPRTKSMKVVGDRLEVWLWAKELWSVLLTKRNALVKAPPKQSWLLFMTNYLMWSGQDILLSVRGTILTNALYSRIIWVHYCRRKMDKYHLQSDQSISAKYVLIRGYYYAREVDPKYCSTDTMWAYVLTKPLQGQNSEICGLSCRTDRDIMMMILSKKKTNKDEFINQWTIKSRLMLHCWSVLKNDNKLETYRRANHKLTAQLAEQNLD